MPLSAPTIVTTASRTTHRVVAAGSPVEMPASMARPMAHGPTACGMVQTSATASDESASRPW